ncbi:MAG: class I SAM-dependent methyltransferase, partial [Acidobacteria bacterium]
WNRIALVDLLLTATRAAESRHFWFRGFRRFVRPVLAAAVPGRPSVRLLDCGCGTGANLRMLGEFGRAFGIDLNEVGVAFARTEGARVARADVVRLPFPDACFDVVTSFDVIYCLDGEAERAAIAEMHRVLRPGGGLVINVAAMPILRGNHSVLSRELRRYTAGSLRERLAAARFRVAEVRYTNATLFPLLLAVRLAQRAAGLKEEGEATREITVPPAPVNAVLTALLAAEARLPRWARPPAGSSLLCRATKE